MSRVSVFLVLVLTAWLIAQENPGPSPDQHNRQNEHLNLRGCVSMASGAFILMQTDPANSYVLEAPKNLKLESYLGKQVEVSGTESPTLGTSSTYRKPPAASATINVTSIAAISKRCTH